MCRNYNACFCKLCQINENSANAARTATSFDFGDLRRYSILVHMERHSSISAETRARLNHTHFGAGTPPKTNSPTHKQTNTKPHTHILHP